MLRKLVSIIATALASTMALSQGKVVLLSWDGAPDWVVDRLLAEGKLPNLAQMTQNGAAAEYMLASFPSKTAVGHASIFTGAWPNVHGITGNSVPAANKSENTFLASRSGFASSALLAEPVYVTAARQGKKVVVLSATQSYPPAPHVQALGSAAKNLITFSGFEGELAPAATHDFSTKIVPLGAYTDLPAGNGPYREIEVKVADTTFYVLAYNDPKDPVNGYDTILIRPRSRQLNVAKEQAILKPLAATDEHDKHWSKPFRVTKGSQYGYTSFRLFELSQDLEKVALYQSAPAMLQGTAPAKDAEAYVAASRGFHSDPFRAYEAGRFGKTLWNGGDGQAEARVVELVRRDVENLKRGIRYALTTWKPDLITHYQPMTDSAGHVWMGVLDPNSPAHDKELAARLWPFYERIYQLEDEWLGDVLAAAKGYNVVLVSDHGMEGSSKTFYPNAVLEKAGLLVRTFGNEVEPAQTKIAATPYSDFFLVVNDLSWKQGIVPPSQLDGLLTEASNQLLSARDPDTGSRIVMRVYRAEDLAHLGAGGPAGGALYLELAPGYYPSNSVYSSYVSRMGSRIGQGTHGFNPERRSMQAIFYMQGPAVTPGPVQPMRQIDVAPTIAKMLGIQLPPSATGRVVEGVR